MIFNDHKKKGKNSSWKWKKKKGAPEEIKEWKTNKREIPLKLVSRSQCL